LRHGGSAWSRRLRRTMPDLSSDPLLASIRQQATFGPDAGSKFAMDALRLCDLFEAMRKSALKMEAMIHEGTK
jgi:hypothetical protein